MPGGDGHGLIKIICVHGVDGNRDDEKDSNTFSLQSLSDIAAQTSEFFKEISYLVCLLIVFSRPSSSCYTYPWLLSESFGH